MSKKRVTALVAGGLSTFAVISGGAIGTPSASAMIPPPSGGCGALSTCIVNEAKYEYSNDDGHKYEYGDNCNYFSSQWHSSGAAKCSGKYSYGEAWCMDFARWVYKQEGASVSGLDHLAASAKNYPTYKAGGKPAVGALALLNGSHHVEIVISVNTSAKTVNTISGNWSDQIYKKTSQPWSNYEGFASPKK